MRKSCARGVRRLSIRPRGQIVLLLASLLAAAVLGPLAAAAIGRSGAASGGAGLAGTGTTTGSGSPYATPNVQTTPIIPSPSGSPLAKRGMWIWVLSASDGGNLAKIVAQARSSGVGTLIVKSGDGTQMWSQFNPSLVSELHADGLHVCAWQFVYGIHPVLEADVGAQAVRDGADCLMIDAESQYQGEYVQAQTYVATLRKLIGASFPVALAGFPYVDFHPGFPYSVFLGPEGAQFNTPQMYWQVIGTTVSAVYSHTYEFNLLYERPIDPLGQVFDSPKSSQIHQFRSMSRSYDAQGVAWWDWQAAGVQQFHAIAQPVGSLGAARGAGTVVSLARGALGDVVVWAQEHLVTAGMAITIDGDFGPQTQAAVQRFQRQHSLPATGVITPATWAILLRYPPVAVKWTMTKSGLAATVAIRRAALGESTGAVILPVPHSAHARAKRDELAGVPGEG